MLTLKWSCANKKTDNKKKSNKENIIVSLNSNANKKGEKNLKTKWFNFFFIV